MAAAIVVAAALLASGASAAGALLAGRSTRPAAATGSPPAGPSSFRLRDDRGRAGPAPLVGPAVPAGAVPAGAVPAGAVPAGDDTAEAGAGVRVVTARLPVSGGSPAAHGRSAVASAAVASASRLASVPAGWAVASHTLLLGGLARSYLTVEPSSLAAAPPASVPVVVLMHGLTMTPAGVLGISGLARQVGPAVLVVPAGWHRSWDAGGCCGAAYRRGVDDVGFVRRAVTAVLAATPAADRRRVYVVGFSNGGRMAYHLACDMPGTFAGFAAVEAVPVAGCSRLHPLDITIVAQQTDPLLAVPATAAPRHVDGHVEPTVAATVERWRTLDGCRPTPTVAADGQAVLHTWICAAGTRLTYVWYPAGTHSWRPATAATPGATSFVLGMLRAAPAPA